MHLIALKAEFALRMIDGDFVFAAPAGGAVVFAGEGHAGEHAVEGEVCQAVDFEELADLFDGALVGD